MADPRRINLDEQAKIQSLTTDIIADGAVTAPKLGDDSVTGVAILDGTITAQKFAPAVFGEGLVYNSLTNAIDVNIDLTELEITADQITIPDGAIKVHHLDIDDDLSINNHQLLSFRVENVTVDPAPGNPGRLIWRTDTSEVKIDTGTAFINAGGHNIEDESIVLPQRPILNFIGAGVTVTDTGTKTQVLVPGTFFAKEFLTVTNIVTDHTIILSQVPAANSVIISWNGLVLKEGALFDFTISGATITLVAGIILTIGDEIQIVYGY